MIREKKSPGENAPGRNVYKDFIHELQVYQIVLKMQNEELGRIRTELEKSKEKCIDLYDSSPTGYATIDINGRIEEINLTALNMLRAKKESLIGKPFTSFIYKEDRDMFYVLEQTVLETGSAYSFDIRLGSTDKPVFHSRVKMMPVKKAGNTVTGFNIVISDITSLKAAEEQAAKAAQELKDRVLRHNNQLEEIALDISGTGESGRKRITALHNRLHKMLMGIKTDMQTCGGTTPGKDIAGTLKRLSEQIENAVSITGSLVLQLAPAVSHEAGYPDTAERIFPFVIDAPASAAAVIADSRSRIRVLIVDDHKIMREGLTQLLSSTSDIEVAGEAFDGANAVTMTRKIRPDIILMDIKMPVMNGIEATRIIKSEFPGTSVIGLTMLDEAESSRDLLNAGAVEYIHKNTASEKLISAVRIHATRCKEMRGENCRAN